MNDYKQWTAAFRIKSLNLTNRARKQGFVDNPEKCRRCGTAYGKLHLHNEDYDVTTNVLSAVFSRTPPSITPEEREQVAAVLEPICWRCHRDHHRAHREAASA
jgi:hypothetical protein